MSRGKPIRAYDYVNHPYDTVRDALHDDAREIFLQATRSAASRAGSVAAGLRINVGGLEVATDIAITVYRVEDVDSGPLDGPATLVELEWEAAQRPGLFPLMKASLWAYALTGTETQLDFDGLYQPPLGLVGAAVDAAVGHRIAEASVHRFITDVASHLRTSLDTA
ncbi:MAG: hypothetical protein HKN72_15335 [Gemmatimonadetes bacterium]|nr:hypothetical protein [Gemmatimonadota bacterium]NNF14600.1 hypothetical protein [Gemmatimonadota bacterium]